MQLRSIDGAEYLLTIQRYQYPKVVGDKYDDNWLMIHGEFQSSEQAWTFTQPGMLTTEAEYLCMWLTRLASGQPLQDDEKIFEILEPDVYMRILDQTADFVSLYIDSRQWDSNQTLYHSKTEIRVTYAALQQAAQMWCAEIQKFPTRTPFRR